MLLTIDQIKAIIDIVVLIAGFSIWRFTLAGTYVEEALAKKQEKKMKRILFALYISLLLCFSLVYGRYTWSKELAHWNVSEKVYDWVYLCSNVLFLISVILALIIGWKRKKKEDYCNPNRIQICLMYIMFISISFTEVKPDYATITVEDIITAIIYVAVSCYVCIKCTYPFENIDKSHLYYEEEQDNGEKSYEYIYHKIEDGFYLCGSDEKMGEHIKIVKLEHLDGKTLYNIKIGEELKKAESSEEKEITGGDISQAEPIDKKEHKKKIKKSEKRKKKK